jgi:hypothetical protein
MRVVLVLALIVLSSCAQPSDDAFIVSNPLDLDQIDRISKFRSCVGHDYSGLNVDGEKETLRSMKHYIEQLPSVQISDVKVFAPFDGTVRDIQEASPGQTVYISVDGWWNFIFFHIALEPGIVEGTDIESGQLIGYVDKSTHNFDMGLKKFGIIRQTFDSPFLHMSKPVLDEYVQRGITLVNIIIPKTTRDNEPCPVQGERNGDAVFPGHPAADFVQLK